MISFDGGDYGNYDGNFDENYYLELSKPPIKSSSFANVVDDLLASEEHSQNNSLLKSQFIESAQLNNHLQSRCNHYRYIIKKNNDELNTLNNQLYILYVLIFIAILLIITQKISYANLEQIYKIVRLNKKFYDPNAPVAVEKA